MDTLPLDPQVRFGLFAHPLGRESRHLLRGHRASDARRRDESAEESRPRSHGLHAVASEIQRR